MSNDTELYKYYMASWNNCSRYTMAEFIHRLYNENRKLKMDNAMLQNKLKSQAGRCNL